MRHRRKFDRERGPVLIARGISPDETQVGLEKSTNRLVERSGPWLIVALHAALVARLVSAQDFLCSRPIANGDYGAHYYQAVHAAEHLRESGSLWGYDPFWMAGYPEGLVSLVDNKAFLLALALAPPRFHALVFNAEILLMLLAVPGLGYIAGRLAHGSRAEASFAGLAGTLVTFTVPLAVFFWGGGAISFFFASVCAARRSLSEARPSRCRVSFWRAL